MKEDIKYEGYLSGWLPDGEYKGKWGGYVIDLENNDVKVNTVYGIRTFNLSVIVIIQNGNVVGIKNDK